MNNPTVYGGAHLGHAKTYITTDYIRRIMRDYFKFDTQFVMNVTDVDDKIILRARQRHLLGKFKDKYQSEEADLMPASIIDRHD
jgi:cysteinyl-tRNA synthetase